MPWLRTLRALFGFSQSGMHAVVSGDHAVIVQVSGNGATITIDSSGAGRLTLERRHLLRRPAAILQELLIADLRCIALAGRDAELERFQTWLANPAPIAARCLAAPSGRGKTRLAIELCDRAAAGQWHVGFIRHTELRRFVAAGGPDLWRWSKPTLAVVDDAAAVGKDLREWLARLASASDGQRPPLRILILDRTANVAYGWWAELIRAADLSSLGPAALIDPPEPLGLSALDDPADRQTVFAATMAAAAALRSEPRSTSLPTYLPESSIERADPFGAPTLDTPLSLIMAGMIAAEIGPDAALALGRNALSRHLADAERARLEALAAAWGVPGPLVAHLAACVTLQQGCDAADALRLVTEETAATGWPHPLAPEALAARLAEALADPARLAADLDRRRLDPVRPRLVGLALIIAELDRDARPLADQAAILDRAFDRNPPRTAETVLDAIQTFAGDDPAHPTLAWLHHLLATPAGLDAMLPLVGDIGFGSIALSEAALALQQAWTDRLAADPATDQAALARAYDGLGARLNALGRFHDAADAGAEAIRCHAALHPPQPVDHAVALLNRANALDTLGRRIEALADTRCAIVLLRRPARTDQNAARLLASAMDAAGARFARAGKRRRSLRSHEDSIKGILQIALDGDRGPDVTAILAAACVNYSDVLAADGQIGRAVESAEQGVGYYRLLASSDPDAHVPPLALALTHLALRLSGTARAGNSVQIAAESVYLYRRLVLRSPDVHRTSLAAALNNLSIVNNRARDPTAAIAALTEADRLYCAHDAAIGHSAACQLPDGDAPRHAAEHAAVLDNLANTLTESAQASAAIDPATRAVKIHRRLAQADPGAFRLALMNSLSILADALTAAGQIVRACNIGRRAVTIGRVIEHRQPGVATLMLAFAQSRFARNLAAAGRSVEALETGHDCLEHLRSRVATQGVPRSDAGMIFANLGLSLVRCGRIEGAIAFLREAEDNFAHAVKLQPFLAARLETVTAERASLETRLG